MKVLFSILILVLLLSVSALAQDSYVLVTDDGNGNISQSLDVIPQASYSPAMSFSDALSHQHTSSVTVEGRFRSLDLDGTASGFLAGWFGNKLTIDVNGSKVQVWVDFDSMGFLEANHLISLMTNSKSLRVTYDPDCGMASQIVPEQ